jgi:hypothetical protein
MSSSGPPLQGVLGAPAVRHSPSTTRDSSLSAGPSAAATSGAASGQAGSSAEARMGPTPGGASAALDAADAQLSGARAAIDGTLPVHAAHGDGGLVQTQSGPVHHMGRPACQGAP